MRYCIFISIWLIPILGCQQNQESASTSSQMESQADSIWFCKPKDSTSQVQWIKTELGRQKAVIVHPKEKPNSLRLVVFLHGDAPFRDPIYQYGLAQSISDSTNTMAVALLRPGYQDDCGDLSEGDKGLMMGDNYTKEVVKSLATSIRLIQLKNKPDKTIVIGHSGGAALAALLAIDYPALFEEAILIACPCNLEDWRKVMRDLSDKPQWSEPMAGLSPIVEIERMKYRKKFHLYVGDQDKVTPSFLSEAFYEVAQKKGAFIDLNIIEGEDHESILKPEILSLILRNAKL